MKKILIDLRQHPLRPKFLLNPLRHLPGGRVLGCQQHSRILTWIVELAGRKLLFQYLKQPGGVLWRIQQLVNTDAHAGLNSLGDGINAALAAGKQHHIQPGFHPLDGIADGGGRQPQLLRRLCVYLALLWQVAGWRCAYPAYAWLLLLGLHFSHRIL